MDDASTWRIGFIDFARFADGAIRGGLLVTDHLTQPYDFRATTPVKPTKVQQILYGKTLQIAMFNDLIGLPLLTSSREKITIVFTRHHTLLSLRPRLEFPLAFLQADKRNEGEPSDVPQNRQVIHMHSNFPTELEFGRHVFQKMAESGDLLEPFTRISQALTEIHKIRPEDK
jgi:hypothetical protein